MMKLILMVIKMYGQDWWKKQLTSTVYYITNKIYNFISNKMQTYWMEI